jgi:tripartite-type tricarboxylate transporter receptor subunit TctC
MEKSIVNEVMSALGVANKMRTPLLPDVPTLAESGVPDAEANTFFGLVAPAGTPAGTPASIIRRINSAMNEGLQTPEVQEVRIRGLAAHRKKRALRPAVCVRMN